MRIAIVGGGISGLVAAWLLEEEHEVVLFERAERLGGHAQTIEIATPHGPLRVDPAAQHFSHALYPRFLRLLDLLGVGAVPSPMSCTLHWPASGRAVSLTPGPRPRDLAALAPWRLPLLLRFRQAIERSAALEDWQIDVDEHLRRLALPIAFERRILRPLLTSVLGTSAADTGRMSARAAMTYPVHHRPSGPLRRFEFVEVEGGVGAYVARLAAALNGCRLELGDGVHGLARDGRRLRVAHRGGNESCDQVVLAVPPWDAAPLVAGLPEGETLARRLAAVEPITTEIAVHGDRRLMPRRRRHWAGFNVRVDPATAEGTIWTGRRQGAEVFKSWVTHGGWRPEATFARISYRHPLMTPEYFRIQGTLAAAQGNGGLWLAGSYLRHIDCHESGLVSALAVARRLLSPGARRLTRLETVPAAAVVAGEDASGAAGIGDAA